MEKTDVFKTCRKSKFLGKKVLRNALALKSKKYKVYSGKHLFWHYCIQLSFVYKTVAQIYREKKGFCQSSLGNEVDFMGTMNVSPNILTKNQNFKKLRHGFADERALIAMTLISFCH